MAPVLPPFWDGLLGNASQGSALLVYFFVDPYKLQPVALASAVPPYPLAADDRLMQQLAADAINNAARGLLQPASRSSALLTRDVLAELALDGGGPQVDVPAAGPELLQHALHLAL